jgi:phosphatidylinositol 4-kinase
VEYSALDLLQFQCERDLLHYLVVVPFEVFTPSAVSAGIEVWTWVIAENPEAEVPLMSEVLYAWLETIKHRKGIFSTALK